jgi:hypothetical protein
MKFVELIPDKPINLKNLRRETWRLENALREKSANAGVP